MDPPFTSFLSHVPPPAPLHPLPLPPPHLIIVALPVQERHDRAKGRMQPGQRVPQADVGPHWGHAGEAVQVAQAPVRLTHASVASLLRLGPGLRGCEGWGGRREKLGFQGLSMGGRRRAAFRGLGFRVSGFEHGG